MLCSVQNPTTLRSTAHAPLCAMLLSGAQVTAMKAAEAAEGRNTRPGRPKVLILGPTRELAVQLLRVSKSLAHHEKFSSDISCGGASELFLKILASHG